MTAHDHAEFVEGCFRCDLSRHESSLEPMCPNCVKPGECNGPHEYQTRQLDDQGLSDVCGEPLVGGYCGKPFSHDDACTPSVSIPEGPGRWMSETELDYFRENEAEIRSLRGKIREQELRIAAEVENAERDRADYERLDAEWERSYEILQSHYNQASSALTEIVAVLGPEVCDCDAHDCGLREEVHEAIHVAKAAMRGQLRGVRLHDLDDVIAELGVNLEEGEK